ncbi:hypothetical protein KIN20_006964 [Parelaphostrongylus tenuis]|uniref:Uncharacterized protein n=1 Tax=Parelaphostrongylus tenuis TaxID=148309 RepID=A0AAD5QGG4_PARTN|nr:hypothetical protein KIN20_006964 [Parelaphostrongylus tenuis]
MVERNFNQTMNLGKSLLPSKSASVSDDSDNILNNKFWQSCGSSPAQAFKATKSDNFQMFIESLNKSAALVSDEGIPGVVIFELGRKKSCQISSMVELNGKYATTCSHL